MRKTIWDGFKSRLKELEILILENDVVREEMAFKLARTRRDIYLEEDLSVAHKMLKEQYNTYVNEASILASENSDFTKQKQELINQTEKILGVHLTDYLSFFHEVKKYERELAYEE